MPFPVWRWVADNSGEPFVRQHNIEKAGKLADIATRKEFYDRLRALSIILDPTARARSPVND
jgi:hypothetical protein